MYYSIDTILLSTSRHCINYLLLFGKLTHFDNGDVALFPMDVFRRIPLS